MTWACGEASDKARKLTVELPLKDKANENEYMWLIRENGSLVQLDEESGNSYTVPGNTGVGTYTFYGLAVQRDGKGNYVTGKLVPFQVKVTKGSPVVDVKKNSGLTYTGNPLRLVRLGATTGGTLLYAVVKKGEAAPKAKDYSTTMPAARDAGEYTVYYRVEGDRRYNDVAAERVILFQRQTGMTEDGVASQELQAYLFSDKAPVCGQTLPPDKVPGRRQRQARDLWLLHG